MTANPSSTYRHLTTLATAFIMAFCAQAQATETENLNIRILPTPGKMVIDGKAADWDLSGGVFVCGDVENLRDKIAVWIHAMYDADNLYVLARFADDTPLNHAGSIAGDHGFQGDACSCASSLTRKRTTRKAWEVRRSAG